MDPESTLSVISVVKYVSLACAGLFSTLSVMTDYKKDGKVTKWGRVGIIGVMLSTIFSVSVLGLEQKQIAAGKKKADDERAIAEAEATREKEEANKKFVQTAERLEAIQSVAGDNLEQSAKNLKLTDAMSADVRKTSVEQTKVVGQTRVIAKDLGTSLKTQETQLGETRDVANGMAVSLVKQDAQYRRIENMALDRDLNAIEISWKPTPDQWREIVRLYATLPDSRPGEDLVPSKSYFFATTITVERFYEHWRINFPPMRRPQGILAFPPVLTNQSGWEAINQVLAMAVPQYFAISVGSNPPISLSTRGPHVSAVSIHQNKISIVLRSPETRVALKLLQSKTITFHGAPFIKEVSLVSRDAGVCLNQSIGLDWGDIDDEYDPVISGPHPLDVKFSMLSECS